MVSAGLAAGRALGCRLPGCHRQPLCGGDADFMKHSPFLLWLGTVWHPGEVYSRLPPCGLMGSLRDYHCSWWVPGVPALAEGPLGQSRMWVGPSRRDQQTLTDTGANMSYCRRPCVLTGYRALTCTCAPREGLLRHNGLLSWRGDPAQPRSAWPTVAALAGPWV